MFAILTKDEKIANDKLIVYRVIPVAQSFDAKERCRWK
jgi:hypothetical protein